MAFGTYNIDVKGKIDELNLNVEYSKLRESYKTQTIFEIIGKGRNETTHSSLLAWLFSGKDLPSMGTESPLMGLFDIIMHRIESQHPDWYQDKKYSDFKLAVRSRELTINNVTAQTEVSVLDFAREAFASPKKINNTKTINTLSDLTGQIDPGHKKGKKDSLDILIACDVAGIKDVERIEIIIENKIHSSENGCKSSGKTEYEQMPQTQRYYWACNRGTNTKILQFFVFLNARPSSELVLTDGKKPSNKENPKVWCTACEHFISINYQDIYDTVLSPLLDSERLSTKTENLLTEYVKSLSIPVVGSADSIEEEQIDIENMTILATGAAERQRLLSFWNDNQDLLFAALEVVEKRDGLASHVWTRAFVEDNPNDRLTPKEVVQLVYDRFREDYEMIDTLIQNDIRNKFNSFCAAKKNGKLDIIAEDDTIKKERIESAFSTIKTLIKKGKLPGTNEIEDTAKSKEDKIRNVYESYRNSESLNLTNAVREKFVQTTFNGFKYKNTVDGNEMSYNIINDHKVEKDTLVNRVYNAIGNEPKLSNYIKDIKVISFDRENFEEEELLYRLWRRYQKLVLAALNVLAETDAISEEDRAGVRAVYNGIGSTGTGRSLYNLTYKKKTFKKTFNSLTMLGVVRTMAQQMIWSGQKGQPSCSSANDLFKRITGEKTEFVKKKQGPYNTNYDALAKPNGTSDEATFIYFKARWTMDANFGKLYDKLSVPNNEYNFVLEKCKQEEQ